ncbi:MAG: 3-deoxy-manno-octulosonate cytidylyltransferase [Steroidobacteraceae bacterium]
MNSAANRFKVVIPARYGSTRLPGKPLLEIDGKPMVQWVVDAACASGANEVLVATDDQRIVQALRNPRGAESIAVMTGDQHRSGTDRIAEVATQRRWSDDTIVVNVQGDEPQMPAQLIEQVAALLAAHPQADMATLCTPIESLEEFLNPNVVKAVSAADGMALYFSRAPIPWHRDTAPAGLSSQSEFSGAMRHLGIYAYRVAALLRLTRLSPSSLELAESLEQLRALQAGMRIAIAAAATQPGMGIDTPQDIERIRQLIAKN